MREEIKQDWVMYKRLKASYPQYTKFEKEYIAGGYYDKSEVRYYGDGKVLEEHTEIGYYQ